VQLTESFIEGSRDDEEGLPPYSYTQAATYSTCPRRYYFAYVLGIRMPPPVVLVQGQVMHRVLERAHRELVERSMPSIADLVDLHEAEYDKVEEVAAEPAKALETARREGRKMLKAYYAGPYQEVVPLEVEKRFDMDFETPSGIRRVCGVIDLIEYPTRPTEIWDIKVSARSWKEDDLYLSPQLSLYARHAGKRRVGIIHLVRSGKVELVSAELAPVHLENNLLWFRDTIQAIELSREKGFWPRTDRDNFLCSRRYCAYYNLCYAEA